MNRYILLLIPVIFVVTSCNLVKIETGSPIIRLYSTYNQTNEQYPGLLIPATAATLLCELKYNTEKPEVYVVNAQQLKQCLPQYDDAIVYVWDPHCPAEQCFSPSLLQKYCDEKKVELFVVAEYYDGEELIQYYGIERPLFGIDTKYYKADFIDKYAKRFEADLTGDGDRPGRMLYFKKGEFMGVATIEFEN